MDVQYSQENTIVRELLSKSPERDTWWMDLKGYDALHIISASLKSVYRIISWYEDLIIYVVYICFVHKAYKAFVNI